MTPTPKHIEEAQILYNAVGFAQRCSGNCEREAMLNALATLLAAQEELEKLGSRVDKLFEAHKQWTLAVSDERNQLRAERDEWKRLLNLEQIYAGAKDATATTFMNQVKKLQTHNAKLLAVAEAAKAYIESDPRYLSATETYTNMCNTLSALEPLGIKV